MMRLLALSLLLLAGAVSGGGEDTRAIKSSTVRVEAKEVVIEVRFAEPGDERLAKTLADPHVLTVRLVAEESARAPEPDLWVDRIEAKVRPGNEQDQLVGYDIHLDPFLWEGRRSVEIQSPADLGGRFEVQLPYMAARGTKKGPDTTQGLPADPMDEEMTQDQEPESDPLYDSIMATLQDWASSSEPTLRSMTPDEFSQLDPHRESEPTIWQELHAVSHRVPFLRQGVLLDRPTASSRAEVGATNSFASMARVLTKYATPISRTDLLAARKITAGRLEGITPNGSVVRSSDGTKWTVGETSNLRLRSAEIVSPGKYWAVSEDGRLLRTTDSGKTWVTAAEGPDAHEQYADGDPHTLLPAPWYYLSLIAVALLLIPALRRPKAVAKERASVSDVLVSDRPLRKGEADPLDFDKLTQGLSRFIRNENTKPPVTIAITGEWGTGKSSIMNLLRDDITELGYRPVWFNAWHHQQEERIPDALMEAIRRDAVPSIWQPRGLYFRWQLISARLGKWLLALSFLLALVFSWFYFGPGVTAGAKFERFWDYSWATGGAVAAGLAWVTAVAKGLTAFGAKPTRWAASLSRTIQTPAGSRTRFEREFTDVTAALRPRNLVILIDDLDRCQPEKVAEMLEAVNFLVSCGDCYVILGIARDRVQRSVGYAFRKLVDGYIGDQELTESGAGQEEATRQQRAAFAKQYLEKLINIDVPVPIAGVDSPGLEQLATSTALSRESDPKWREMLTAAWRKVALPLGMALAISVGIWAGSRIDQPESGKKKSAPPKVAAATNARTTDREKGGDGNKTELAGTGEETTSESSSSETASATTANNVTGPTLDDTRVGNVVSASYPRSPGVWPWSLALVLLGLGVWRLSINPQSTISDSTTFGEALKLWFPLTVAKSSTPRSIKRFLNRARFLAMSQRRPIPAAAAADAEPSWRKMLAVVFPLRPPEEEMEDGSIPEDVLVALCAIEHSYPEWLKDDAFWQDPWTRIRKECPNQAVRIKDSGSKPDLASHRDEFLRISRGVRSD